ncbi:hypothetical protein EWH70_19595 [Amycolatopsis suaedae]|uniref:EfeO-type cupredoxin-like domain-containing protein n=1 Tax=Amycolatopsis suaedae TaxID=2510978 RepID=A0A4Q7J6M5_9PSEU|nr:hypothetical protein EWH70_19595 [Amycolatopsis suaedae]
MWIVPALVAAACGSGETAQPAPPTETSAHRFAMAGGHRTEGPDRIEVTVGSPVRIEVTCDADDELHVHGYDKAAQCGPGAPAALTFTADVPGVFEVEMHASGPLTQLRVQEPR